MLYEKEYLREIRFPLGGIGSGSISIAGNGRLCDWEIFNRPAKGSVNGHSHIAVSVTKGEKRYTKILNGDLDRDLAGQYSKSQFSGYGHGASVETMCGFPHFKHVTFDGQFPIARLIFTDEEFPGKVILTAFNPFIPRDAENSSIPAAFFEVSYENDTDSEVKFEAVLSVCNPFSESANIAIGNNMVMLRNHKYMDEPLAIGYGDLTIATDCPECNTQEYWYRGGWYWGNSKDHIVKFWNDFSQGRLPERHYDTPGNRDTASVCGRFSVQPGETESVRFVISWNIPNCYNYWSPLKDENGNDVTWKNYYATKFSSSLESARYALKHFTSLYQRTATFKEALFSQTLDPYVIDAAASTLSVLKSPTVLRLENGEFYGWEGVHEGAGSCEGTCQHVWNYAYALCFLFPELERSIHRLELDYSMNEDGGTVFRLSLPPERGKWDFRPCVDGQMGTIIKLYRDWKISGDTETLRSDWNSIKKLMSYTWCETNPDRWDRDMDGVLEGRQHHTLDMELFGPHAWLEGFYLAALKACAEMAHELGDPDEKLYTKLFEQGYQWTKENLFNGNYFIQKLDLHDKAEIDQYENTAIYWNDEDKEIKYQIGDGCEVDQLCGQWHATINSLGYVFDKEQIHTALRSMFANNYKESLRNFVNPWRIYALNDEPAAIICDYPKGTKKPAIPIPYCEECFNGLEYQLAGMLISEGFIDEGLTIVRSVRERYDGSKRNPYNEFECGSNYARSMASFALIPLFSGFYFDMPHGCIGFSPVIKNTAFKYFWSLECGYGTIERSDDLLRISVIEGSLPVSTLRFPFVDEVKTLYIDEKETAFDFTDGILTFDAANIKNNVTLKI